MIDIYEISGIWTVTYQRNEHSPIETLYEGTDSNEAYEVLDYWLEEWA